MTVSLTDRRNARREPRFYVSDRDPADTYQPAEPESGIAPERNGWVAPIIRTWPM